MKERPILFSGPMVRAILDGRKTQTRRVVKNAWQCLPLENVAYQRDAIAKCPYGVPGDRLWVRETWWTYPHVISNRLLRDGADTWPKVNGEPIAYAADGDADIWSHLDWVKKPSIHMPRWASRITLEVVGVRVERVQDISEEDAKAEGLDFMEPNRFASPGSNEWMTFDAAFECLWDTVNGDGAWDRNDWVWVVEFKRLNAT